MDLIAYAVPFFLLAIALEVLWGLLRKRNTYRLNDSFSSLMLGILSQAQKLVVFGLGGWVYQHITLWLDAPLWSSGSGLTWVIAFVLYDFCYYWLHRLGHERQILWAAHVAHHQSEEYNLSTALRQTSSGFLFSWIFYIPMYAIGIPADVVVTVGALNLIYQFWVHTRHIPELGWFEWVFVTPSNHRVHHAQNDCYMDRNYGGVFIVWDRLFGTYQREIPDEPCVYGIRGAIRSWNPIVALTHIYTDMIRDIYRTRSWGNRLRVVFARTGWQPTDLAPQYRREKASLDGFEPYNPAVDNTLHYYGAIQIAGATGLLAYGQFTPMGTSGAWLWLTLLIWTGIATAWWLEGRYDRLCGFTDGARLLCILSLSIIIETTSPWGIGALLWVTISFALLVLHHYSRAAASVATPPTRTDGLDHVAPR